MIVEIRKFHHVDIQIMKFFISIIVYDINVNKINWFISLIPNLTKFWLQNGNILQKVKKKMNIQIF